MTAPRTIPAPRQTEKDFGDQLLQLAGIFRWRSAHFRPAMTAHGWRTAVQGDGKGFPDLVLTRPPRVIFAELKIPRTAKQQPEKLLSPEQQEWLEQLTLCTGVETYLWTPRDWDEITEVLR